MYLYIYVYFLVHPFGVMDRSGMLKHLVPGAIVQQHLKTCKLGATDCGLCAVHQAWLSHKKPWLRAILVDGEAKLGSGQSWIYWQRKEKKPWQECTAEGSAWAKMLWDNDKEGPADSDVTGGNKKRKRVAPPGTCQG